MAQRRRPLLRIGPAAVRMIVAGRAWAEPHGHGGVLLPRRITRALAGGLALAAALGAGLPAWGQGTTERVSLGPNGVQGNGDSDDDMLALSADGRFVAFSSVATNLVRRDANNARDVFVHDRQTGRTERVSVGPGGVPGSGGSENAALSADGRFVAFESRARNLVPGDTNGEWDVFVRDRRTGVTERVSVGPGGIQGDKASYVSALSADGRFVAFSSWADNLVPGDTNGTYDVFVHDRRTGTTERVSLGPNGRQGNGNSDNPSLSSDGQFVAFYSYASNLVPGDTNGERDVFVRDRRTGTTARVSLGPNGVQGNDFSGSYGAIPALSANGRFVAFDSSANNLVQDDTNGQADVYVHTR
jgi:Tol biopolymer transport system component